MQYNVHVKEFFESRISRNRNRDILTETVSKSYLVVYFIYLVLFLFTV